jgi:hypothetical protein
VDGCAVDGHSWARKREVVQWWQARSADRGRGRGEDLGRQACVVFTARPRQESSLPEQEAVPCVVFVRVQVRLFQPVRAYAYLPKRLLVTSRQRQTVKYSADLRQIAGRRLKTTLP